MKKFLDSKFSNLLFAIFIALVVCFVIKTFILETQIVKSSNMSPTLTSGDFVLINKLNKITGYIKKTDIVKYYDEKNSESNIARVIAMPKDSVEIINDDIFVNGKRIYEPYILLQQSKKLNNNKWVLSKDEYFVINDVIDNAVKDIETIIAAEKLRVKRHKNIKKEVQAEEERNKWLYHLLKI